MSKYKPFIDIGPGDTIREELEYYDWDQKDLAEIMDRSEKNISQLLNNKSPITFETALQLNRIFKQSVQFWLNLDANYRQKMQEDAKITATAARALIYRYMPVRELRKYLPLPKKAALLKSNVLDFWGIDELDFGFLEQQAVAHFRKSSAYNNFNPFYALTWLQLVRKHATRNPVEVEYSSEALTALAKRIPSFSIRGNGIPEFVEALEEVGVAFLQVDHMPQTYTDGASLWCDGKPVIAYTARHDRNDNFWFTITHEIGHLLLHHDDATSFFIDSMDHLDATDCKENEANDFAEGILKTHAVLKAFEDVNRPSKVRVCCIAEEFGLHPAIVAGCLQHHGKASWQSFHNLKEPVRSQLDSHALSPIDGRT